jgi:uroporphyrinogen-III synthase
MGESVYEDSEKPIAAVYPENNLFEAEFRLARPAFKVILFTSSLAAKSFFQSTYLFHLQATEVYLACPL